MPYVSLFTTGCVLLLGLLRVQRAYMRPQIAFIIRLRVELTIRNEKEYLLAHINTYKKFSVIHYTGIYTEEPST